MQMQRSSLDFCYVQLDCHVTILIRGSGSKRCTNIGQCAQGSILIYNSAKQRSILIYDNAKQGSIINI